VPTKLAVRPFREYAIAAKVNAENRATKFMLLARNPNSCKDQIIRKIGGGSAMNSKCGEGGLSGLPY